MKLQIVKLYEYHSDFKHPIVTPKTKLNYRKVLIVEIIMDTDQHFFGECNAFETDWYATETIAIVQQQTIKWFKQYQNHSFDDFEAVQKALDDLIEFPATRSMLIMAFYQMFYELKSFSVPYGATVSGLNESNLKQLNVTRPHRVKIKWTNHILEDIKILSQLSFQPYIVVDANETVKNDEVHKLKALADKSLLYIEEPFKSLEILSHIDEGALPPVAIDEKAISKNMIKQIIDNYAVEVVVLKPFRLGGIDRVLEIIELLKEKEIKIVIGGMYEYGLSRYFTAMLAQYADYPSDITPEGYYFQHDMAKGVGILKGGSIYFEPPLVNKTQFKRIY